MGKEESVARKCLNWLNSYRKEIMNFDRDGNDFKPAHYPPKEDGTYLTIRCGLTGIYQMVNEWKDGKWQCIVLDGSETIAYSRDRIEIPDFSKEDEK